MHLSGTVHDVVCRDAFVTLFRQTFSSAIQSPMLRGIFGMIRRVAGDPGVPLMHYAARIYGYVTSDIETLRSVIRAPRHATMFVEAWPPRRRSRSKLTSSRGSAGIRL